MFSKAQAATEFLLSYGWAILIVLVLVSGFAYTATTKLRANQICTVSLPLSCLDFSYSDGNVNMVINNMGSDNLLNITSAVGSHGCIPISYLASGKNAIISCPYDKEQLIKEKTIFNYTKEYSKFRHSTSGEIVIQTD